MNSAELEIPRPLDDRINQGIMLQPGLVGQQIGALNSRIFSAFRHLRSDESREFGTGLAFGYNIPDGEILLVEHRLLQLATRFNNGHNLEAVPTATGVNFAGNFLKKPFFISSRVGAIALASGKLVEDAYLLSLHSKVTQLNPPKNPFGNVGTQITRNIDRPS